MHRFFVSAILLVGCTQDTTPKAFNTNPDITITSHADGADVQEGLLTEFHAQVSDANHDTEELSVAWLVGDELICDWAPPSAVGASVCEVAFALSDSNLVAEVRDPEGAGGRAEIAVNVIATEAPSVEILSPAEGDVYYSDQLIRFSGVLNDAEDAVEQLVSVWESSGIGDLGLDASPDANGEIEDFRSLPEGEHAITLTVTDSTQKSTTASVLITVGPENSLPACAITSPASGSVSIIGQSVVFTADVSDADIPSSDLTVIWSSDKDGTLGNSTPSSSGDVIFSFDALSAADHTISLEVTDEAGSSCSDIILLTVGASPSVVLTAPSNGDVYQIGDSVIFSAEVSDSEDQPGQVALSWVSDIDGELSTQGATSSGTAQFIKNDLSTGLHNLILTATDSDGLTSDDICSFRVNTPPDAPLVEILPDPAVTTDELNVTVTGAIDADGDVVSLSFAWTNNGVPTAHSAALVPASDTSSGETWTVTVTPNDGFVDGSVGSASMSIDNSPPSISSVSVSPSSASPNDLLSCTVSASDVDGDPLTQDFEWQNGSGVVLGSGNTLQLNTSICSAGDTITCFATISDPSGASVTDSADVLIDNSLPEVTSLSLSPLTLRTNDAVTAQASTSDADGDPVSLSYEWFVDGALVSETSNTLSGQQHFDKNQTVSVTVTPNDGISDGPSYSSTPITVENTPPTVAVISIAPTAPMEGQDDLVCTLDVPSADDDGDLLSYQIYWLVDGVTWSGTTLTVSHPGDAIPGSMTSAGETWSCLIHANDGEDDGPSSAAAVTIESLCPSLHADITTQAEADSYVDCVELDVLYVNATSGISSVNLPNLVTVNNYVYFSINADVYTVSLAALETVGSYIYIAGNTDIDSIDLSSLQEVGTYLYVDGNNSLDTFTLSNDLTLIGEYSYFSNNPNLCVPNLSWSTISLDYHYDNGNMSCTDGE